MFGRTASVESRLLAFIANHKRERALVRAATPGRYVVAERMVGYSDAIADLEFFVLEAHELPLSEDVE